MQGFLNDERGSTRLALSIAAVVLAVLALVATPMLAGQGRRAQDTRARSQVSRLATQVESCRVTASSYAECDERSEVDPDDTVRWGRTPGEAGVLSEHQGQQDFTAYAVSGRGSRLYVWDSRDSRVSRYVCGHGSVKRLERDGCDGPGW